jgi:hypothetical protein
MKNLAKQAIRRLVGQKSAIAKTDPLPHKSLQAESITGGFSRRECRRLYLTTVMTRGPILEIGHFMGRSTACICEAIRDVRKPRVFRSYDLASRSNAEFQESYTRSQKAQSATAAEAPALRADATPTRVATENLDRLELGNYVQLIAGNAFEIDHDKYDMIFCDTGHEPREIENSVPHMAARSNHGCVWALHGMNEENIETVAGLAEVEFCELTGSLGVFIFFGKDATAEPLSTAMSGVYSVR